MKIIYTIIILSLVGCSSLPSFEYCDDVEYTRKGTDINFTAHCTAPIGG